MQTESTKRCTACGAEKPLSEYGTRRASFDGKTAKCRPCYSAYMAQQRAKHRDQRLADKRAYYQANKAAHLERGRRYRSENPAAVKAAERRWRRDNPQRTALYSRRRKEKVRRLVLTYYGRGTLACVCCGEGRYEFLALDHIDGGGGAHRRAIGRQDSLGMCRWAIENGWPPMFRTLCHNCNAATAYYGVCPHDAER